MSRTLSFLRKACGCSLWLASGCSPELADDSSTVDAPRILAVVADPAEARPGEEVSYRVLSVDAGGRVAMPDFSASYCLSPKPLTENDSVSRACLGGPGVALAIFPPDTASGPVPRDACALFGPEPPPGDFRPRDADSSGGYFAPLRLSFSDETLVFHERISCNPPDVDADVARDFSARYRPNENPATPALSVERAADGSIVLRARVPLASAEAYVRIDPVTRTVRSAEERLDVSWFSTSGAPKTPRATLRDVGEALEASSRLSALAGVTHVWAVVRDSRGGTSFAELEVEDDGEP